MAIERTLSIIKPDATARNITGKINACLEKAGLRIIAQKRLCVPQEQWEVFYEEHQERDYFHELCDFMSSGLVVVQILEGEDAVNKNRKVMGDTDPTKALAGTVRKEFGLDMPRNSVHGSKDQAAAAKEIDFFFKDE